jgi:hypothetical protein
MNQFVVKGAHMISTDSVLVASNVSLDCPALDEMKSVGGGMEHVIEADAAVIVRAKRYALLQRSQNLRLPKGMKAPLAVDASLGLAVVKVARHGSREKKEEFADSILRCLRERKPLVIVRKVKALVSATTAVRKRLVLNAEDLIDQETRFDWRGARVPRDRDLNIFTGATKTRPFETVGHYEGSRLQRRRHEAETNRYLRRRRRRLSKQLLDLVFSMFHEGRYSVEDIAKRTGVPRKTVKALAAELKQTQYIGLLEKLHIPVPDHSDDEVSEDIEGDVGDPDG